MHICKCKYDYINSNKKQTTFSDLWFYKGDFYIDNYHDSESTKNLVGQLTQNIYFLSSNVKLYD